MKYILTRRCTWFDNSPLTAQRLKRVLAEIARMRIFAVYQQRGCFQLGSALQDGHVDES